MTSTLEVTAYLDQLLDTASIPDYGNALNGLQLENDGQQHSYHVREPEPERGSDGSVARHIRERAASGKKLCPCGSEAALRGAGQLSSR